MTTTDSAHTPRWMLTQGADLAIRVWDEDCLVHHALSNDTHRLAAWLVPALRRLGEPAPAGLDELAALMGAEPEEAAGALQQLEQLLLVRRC